MNKTGVFLQVRLNSSRLPGKALLELSGKTVIVHAMEALSKVNADVFSLLTDEESSKELRTYAKGCGFEVFCGDPDDVLCRYAAAVTHFGVDRYMRATGDNPLVSPELADSLVELHEEVGADFSGYLGPPLGTGIEFTESAAILTAAEESTDLYEREHVSPFIYHRPERFTVYRPWAPDDLCLPESKVTLDTVADYDHLKKIYAALYKGEPIPIGDLVQWLKNEMRSDPNESYQPNHTPYTVGKTR